MKSSPKKPEGKATAKKQGAPKRVQTPEEIVIIPFDEKEVMRYEKTLTKPVAMFVGIRKTKTGIALVIRPISEKQEGPGRPPIDRDAVLPKLVEAFKKDATREEACRKAKIGTTTFERYMKDDEEFRGQIEDAQDYALEMAKEGVVNHLEKKRDPDFALRFLERRQRARYALRSEITGEDGNAVEVDILGEARRRSAKYQKPRKA